MNKKINYIKFIPVVILIFMLWFLRSQFTNVPLKNNEYNNPDDKSKDSGDKSKNFRRDLIDIYNRFKSRFDNSMQGRQLPGVDCVYVITMPQRKEYISEEINKLGLNAVYFDAIKPQDIKEEEYEQLTMVKDPRSRIYGKYTRFAVLLSFLMCFINSLENGYSTIVIFEDDMKPLTTLETFTNGVREFNNSSLDVFYMGYCFLNCKQRVGKNYDYLIELTNPDLLCCHSICIKTHILPKLIEYCIPMLTNSDELFRNFYLKNKIKVCVPKTVYFTQNRKTLNSLNESIADG